MHKCLFVVRLAGGKSYNRGRVEVYYNGEWGTVCKRREWDSTEASVVCRQLKFGDSGHVLSSSYFEKGEGPIILSNVECSRDDHTLSACGHSGVAIAYNCDHDDDAGVICDDGMFSLYCCIIRKVCH